MEGQWVGAADARDEGMLHSGACVEWNVLADDLVSRRKRSGSRRTRRWSLRREMGAWSDCMEERRVCFEGLDEKIWNTGVFV